jgi:hypothetical protein
MKKKPRIIYLIIHSDIASTTHRADNQFVVENITLVATKKLYRFEADVDVFIQRVQNGYTHEATLNFKDRDINVVAELVKEKLVSLLIIDGSGGEFFGFANGLKNTNNIVENEIILSTPPAISEPHVPHVLYHPNLKERLDSNC